MTIVEFIEKDMGVELLDCQKKMLNEIAKKGESFRATIRKGCIPKMELKKLNRTIIDLDIPDGNGSCVHLIPYKGDDRDGQTTNN